MSLNRVMNMANQSMSNAKAGIATTSHNIANADTEGFSRQRVDFVTNSPIVRNGQTMGSGAKIRQIKRIHDDFVEAQLRNDTTKKGEYEARFHGCKQLESLFNESVEKGIGHHMNEFYSSLQRLSEAPEEGAIREMVKVSAQDLCNIFNHTYKEIGWVREDIDNRIDGLVSEANNLASEIADLNGSIKDFQIMGRNANDFIDERNVRLKRLGEIVDIKVVEDDSSNLIVRVANSGNLVDNTDTFTLVSSRTVGGKGDKHIHLLSPTGGEKDITGDISSGEVAGYFKVRDSDIVEALDRLNMLAGTIVTRFNAVHRDGYGIDNSTGNDFFRPPDIITDAESGAVHFDFSGAAEHMSVSDDILDRTALIAAATRPGSVADNRNVLRMIALTREKILDEGVSSFDDYYTGTVGVIGLKTDRVGNNLEHQRGILSQLNLIRESISGVSLDEETTELIKHQHNFDAAARLITVADELFNTVLNLKR